ncbi:hypothetical protein [Sphaerisporangium sp. TRM90804]|uniref:hypothetical protein n=1 Tax=Sphaerisporangium sp. TRM90804 TaxID=3031113 RepID=UPI00244AFE69|nr:hypothetical protein [Sphaerisporangium sp. TRM90804]MDH2429312.1 hypothetical protein [Sphaerisporangium sp. TRM90804]
MSYPQIIVECQFTEPTWTDISPWLRGASVQRGSSRVESPITRYDAGTATIRLDNRDRRFDPTNLAGPYTEAYASDSGVRTFTCEVTQSYGQGWTVDVKSAVGLQASVVGVSSRASGTTGSFTVSKPSGVLSGHRLLAFHFCDVGTTLGSMGTPTGGASWGTAIGTRSEGDDTLLGKVWAKTAGGSEPSSYTFTQNSGADGVVIIVAVRDWDASSSEVVLSQSNPESAAMGTPATTPHATNDLEIRVAAGSQGGASGATWTPPQDDGWSELADRQSGSYTTASLAAKQLTGFGSGSATRVKPGRPIRLRASFPFAATTNLVQNPSFETDTTGWAATANTAISRVPDVARHGGYALEIRRTATNPPFQLYGAAVASVAGGATTGETVTISAWVYIPAASFPKVTGIVIGADGVTFDFVSTAGLVADAWYRVTRTAVLTATLDDIEVQVWTNDTHADGQIVAYIDAVQAEEKPAATPYCDGSLPACSWTGTAHASSSSRPASFTWDLFTGFVDDWLINWTQTYDSEVTVPCTDGLGVLADYDRAPVAAVGAGEDAGDRVERILDSLDWPASDRQIAVGNTTLQATTLEGDGLSELQLVADTEIGEVYVNGSGDVVFRNRQGLLVDTRSTIAQARFGPGGSARGRLTYHDVGVAYDRSQMANHVRIARVGGAPQTASDAASRAEYRTKTYPRDDLIMQSDAEALAYAQWVLSIAKEPELRFDQLVVRPEADPDELFPVVLGREIGDRILIERQPPGGGDLVSREVFIRGVTHEIGAGRGGAPRWETSWPLQAAGRAGSFWTLGHPTLGRVDSNSLVY